MGNAPIKPVAPGQELEKDPTTPFSMYASHLFSVVVMVVGWAFEIQSVSAPLLLGLSIALGIAALQLRFTQPRPLIQLMSGLSAVCYFVGLLITGGLLVAVLGATGVFFLLCLVVLGTWPAVNHYGWVLTVSDDSLWARVSR